MGDGSQTVMAEGPLPVTWGAEVAAGMLRSRPKSSKAIRTVARQDDHLPGPPSIFDFGASFSYRFTPFELNLQEIVSPPQIYPRIFATIISKTRIFLICLEIYKIFRSPKLIFYWNPFFKIFKKILLII
jgi:hypothetical protein